MLCGSAAVAAVLCGSGGSVYSCSGGAAAVLFGSCSGGSCAAVLCGSGGSVAAVLQQVVVRFAQELLYSGHRENVFLRSIIYGPAQNRLYCFNLPSSQSVNYVSMVTRNV